jgi:hypothetical protein
MLRTVRTRIALTLAVTAIAAMSVAPAYAAPASQPRAPRPAQAAPSVVFQPDLRVTGDGDPYYRDWEETIVHRFKVTNIGAATSGAIALKGTCRYTNPNDDLFNHVVLAQIAGGLESGHSMSVNVVCDRTTDILQDAILTAGTQDDEDTSNNTGKIDM